MKLKMFSSLKLNALKCQSNDGGGENKKKKCEHEDEDDLSDHMYEKLPNHDHKPCKCHFSHIKRSPKPSKTPFTKRISKWRMECPGITNIRSSQNDSKNNEEDGIRELPNIERLVKTKVTTVNVQREDGNLGITLRRGFHQNPSISRPVVITQLKPDGPAAREGTIKPGDRLLAVDGVSLQGSSLNEAQMLLRQQSATTLLTIEYDVNILDTVEHASGPLLVEIERASQQQLGLTLLQNDSGIFIERVKPGSLADRCGALHVGDEILAVNTTRVDGGSVSIEDVIRILECECPIVRLEILPTYASNCFPDYETWRTREQALSLGTLSGHGTLKGNGSRRHRECKQEETENGLDYKTNHINPHGFCGTEIALTHCETLHTTLSREDGSFGLQFIDAPDGTVRVNTVTPGGSAERSQCIHPGDRLLAINHRSITLDNLTAKDINDLLEFKSEASCSKLSLHTEFDVLDTVVPASGIFTVKLAKRGSGGLGITMTASKSSGFRVCEMKKGSIAHRAGSLISGDKLLAINSIPLDQCSVEYAAHILQQSANIVTLKVQREDNSDVARKITYTVDLQRFGGPLGITIAGSEEPFHPITISGLTAGGLAEQTGVIHVGDEILAINGHLLYGEPLSKAHNLLQSSSDLVTLKLSRSIVPICRIPNSGSPILPSSIDSAVESWDSSRLDLTSSPDHHKTTKESRNCLKRNPQSWPSQCTTFRSPVIEILEKTPSTNKNSDLAILDEITSENLKIKQELDLLSIKLDEQRKSKLHEEEIGMNHFSSNDNNNNNDNRVFPSLEENEIQSVQANGDVDDECQEDGIYGEVKPSDKEFGNGGRESFMTNDFENFEITFLPETRNWSKNQYFGNENNQDTVRNEFLSSQLYEVTLYKDPIYEDFGFSVSDGLYERGVFINRIRKGGPADLSNILKPYDRILQVNETYTQDFDCCLTVPLIASAGDKLDLLVARNSETGVDGNKFNNKGISTMRPCEELRRIFV